MATQINLFGGPSVGKSTAAYNLTGRMKKRHYKVEFNSEYAKKLTYGKDYTKLKDQVLILGQQHHPQWVMQGQLDYVVHDSPFVMGLVYLDETDLHIPVKEFTALSVAMYKTYDNINILIERDNIAYPYETYGRNQTLAEAEEKDRAIKQLLEDNDIPYYIVKSQNKTDKAIYKLIKDVQAGIVKEGDVYSVTVPDNKVTNTVPTNVEAQTEADKLNEISEVKVNEDLVPMITLRASGVKCSLELVHDTKAQYGIDLHSMKLDESINMSTSRGTIIVKIENKQVKIVK